MFHHAAGIFGIHPGPLITGLKQMDVDAMAGMLRSVRDSLEQCVAAPLYAVRPKLHIEHGIG